MKKPYEANIGDILQHIVENTELTKNQWWTRKQRYRGRSSIKLNTKHLNSDGSTAFIDTNLAVHFDENTNALTSEFRTDHDLADPQVFERIQELVRIS
jgi:hypothetical protein